MANISSTRNVKSDDAAGVIHGATSSPLFGAPFPSIDHPANIKKSKKKKRVVLPRKAKRSSMLLWRAHFNRQTVTQQELQRRARRAYCREKNNRAHRQMRILLSLPPTTSTPKKGSTALDLMVSWWR